MLSNSKGKGLKYFRSENNTYKGDFFAGSIEGKGVMDFWNGDRYEGDFVNDTSLGKCKYIYNNSDYYEGKIPFNFF
jgi:hypothetical protein